MPQLYAIAASMERARFFLSAGAPVVQLRIKDAPLQPHEKEIRNWAQDFPVSRVIVNDDLDFAQAVGAWGVHLGQEDLRRYPRERVASARLKVGISTHNDAEIALAKTYGAAMLGFGPIFHTTTKTLTHQPQGVEPLREAVRSAGLPIIAIGGIVEENLEAVVATGCAYVAMIAYLDRFTTREQIRSLMKRLAGGR